MATKTMAWQEAYRQWQTLADRGYGERCYTPDAMERTDRRIRKAKERYERLLKESKAVESSL
jgi:hypothetical protein